MSSEYIWETFDGLFKTVHRQGRRVEELEARIAELERRLDETRQADQQLTNVSEMPVERAA
jgi:BMFP domain-containing protein YqiC